MKSILKYLLLFILPISIFGCKKAEMTPDEINHSMITTSFGTTEAIMQVNDVMSFVDLSRGVVSREWTFPEGAVTDTTGNALVTSSLDNQKVRFVQPGEHYVRIKQVFGGDFYLDTEFVPSDTYEESIKVTVYDSVRASYVAINLADDEKLAMENGAQNEIKAGSIVRFGVTSTGNPATNVFTISNEADGVVATGAAKADPETGEVYADIQLAMPGTFDVKLSSSNAFGISALTYTDLITVIASDEPIYLNSISRTSDAPSNVIGLEFSRGMIVKEGFDPAAFTLQVTNGAKAPNITVSEVTAVSNIVNLTLSEEIYSSDVVLLSYDNTKGELCAVDNANTIQESFTAQAVTFPVVDILSTVGYDSSFEGSAENWKYLWWGGNWAKYSSEFSTAQYHTGAQSFKFEMSNREGFGYETAANEKSGAVLGNKVDVFPVEPGSYILGVWVYIENIQQGIPAGSSTDFIFSFNEALTYDNQTAFNNDNPVGEWFYRTQTIPVKDYSGDATFFIRGNNQDFAESFIVYLDDMTLSKAEPRP